MQTHEDRLAAALAHIDEDELCDLALKLTAIPSPTGEEREVGEFIVSWLRAAGVHAFTQEVEDGRVNAVGVVPGEASGTSLMFNGHLDTGAPIPHELAAPGVAGQPEEIIEPYREDGILYGTGMDNMQSGLAAIMGAAVACHRSGVSLLGDVIIAGVCGEMGVAPIDQYQGRRYRSKGVGTRHLLTHGVVSDYAVVADGSRFGLTWAECGVVYAKVSTAGRPLYTPFTRRTIDANDSDNAIIQMNLLIGEIETWAAEFESRNVFRFEAGEIHPRVSIGAISGGVPFKVAVSPISCSIYVDIRMPPGMRPMEAMREFRMVVDGVSVDATVEFYVSQQGYVGQGIEPIAEAIAEGYERVTGATLKTIAPVMTSMWTDTNIYNEVGIPAVKFGIGAAVRERDGNTEWILDATSVEDLLAATRIYVATALRMCA